ncbi:MAG: S41 family peptidase [Saprospiraceae bacterium]|nr:S41 family peptidase [Saprospiraceae bacterium]
MQEDIRTKFSIIQPLLIAAVLAVGVMIGFRMNGSHQKNALIDVLDVDGTYYPTGRVEELLRFIESKYVDSIDTDTLIDDAVFALVQNLDPHSTYLTPEEVEEVNNQMEGQFYGIGIETLMIRDTAVIYKTLEDSPARKKGLLTGDRILKIDGDHVAGQKLPFSEIRKKMKKREGNVLLEILRKGKKISTEVTVQDIPVPSISSAYEVDPSTIYIKIDRFGSNTYQEFMNHVERLFGESKTKNLIIDVKDNPGGFLPEATNILCQIFEDKDKILVTTKSKNNKSSEYKTTGKRFFGIQKVVVLVDENSASASEIIAGALQDWDRGRIIGRRTYGKGLVQEQYDLQNGGAIRLTVAKYYTPSGRSIQRDYRDKNEYEEDHITRLENGDYFTESKNKSHTESGFTSLVKGRKLASGGGVYPDDFVALDSTYFHPDFTKIEPFFVEYFLKNMDKKPFFGVKTYQTIREFVWSGEDFDRFLVFADVKVTPGMKEKLSGLTKNYFKEILAGIYLSQSDAIRITNEEDAVYQKALDYLKIK